MQIQLINGQFTAAEVIHLITQMVQVKIKFHENKIELSNNQEDIKMRENKIKFLQNELNSLRKNITNNPGKINLSSSIQVHNEMLMSV